MQLTSGVEYGIEGSLYQCLDHLKQRGRRQRCYVNHVFAKAQRRLSAILEQTTLEDIVHSRSWRPRST